MTLSGGRFDFDDGGTYCGGWESGRAHGHGICTGPKNQGEFAGSWNHGFEVIGVYTWPSGNTYDGNWSLGKRHGLGVETKGKWQYKGEWTHGFKGRYGIRCCTTSRARYEGTWVNGLQDGYGTETYADEGSYHGQWMGGMRHGYGVRKSAPYGIATFVRNPLRSSVNSLPSDHSGNAGQQSDSGTDVHSRGGFVLTNRKEAGSSSNSTKKKNFLRSRAGSFRRSLSSSLRKRSKSSTSIASSASRSSSVRSGKSYRSDYTGMSMGSSCDYGSSTNDEFGNANDPFQLSTIEDDVDTNTVETYHGQWKNDKRDGYGVSSRTDGHSYYGEWMENQRHGYGCTTFSDKTTEEGKYKHNVLVLSRRKVLGVKTGKIKEKVENSVKQATRAGDVAKQKAEISLSRTGHSIAKAEQADSIAQLAREESKIARCVARDLAPDFHQPGLSNLLARGEDPFRDLEHHGEYNADRERMSGVAGPESYRQFITDHDDATPVVGRNSIDATNAPGTDTRPSSPSHSHGRKSSFRRLSIFGSKNKLHKDDDAANVVAPSPGHVSPSPSRKQNLLSPNTAMQSNTKSESTEMTDNKEENSRTLSSSQNSGQSTHHKTGFLRSLLGKPKKSSSNGASKSSESAIYSPKEDFNGLNKESWDQKTAESKRSLFKKSASSPEPSMQFMNSYGKNQAPNTNDESSRPRYIAGYENEMFSPLESAGNKDPSGSWTHYESPHVRQDFNKKHRDNQICSEKHVNPQIQITVAEEQGAAVSSNSVPHEQSKEIEARLLSKNSDKNGSQSTTELIAPAFANYNTKESSEASDSVSRRRMRNIYLRKKMAEDPGYEDNQSMATRKYSPLPTRLRHNTKSSPNLQGNINILDETISSKTDSGKALVISLVVLLILGFAAVFSQFM